jgi:hypothetical protein
LLAACGPQDGGNKPPPEEKGTISGTLSGPAGADLTAVGVTACPVAGGTCLTAARPAVDGSFSITGLQAAAYDLTAWADLAPDGEVGAGDLHAVVRVTPPATGLDVKLTLLTSGGGQGVEEGIVKGRAVNEAGQPVAGATVIADNTLFYNTNVIGVTDAQGFFRLDISQPVGTWTISATTTFEFDGRSFTASLTPHDLSPFAGAEGAIRDFTLTLDDLSGPALIQTSVGEYTPYEEIEVTLTPVGPIVDGSAGSTITSTLVVTGDGWAILGVPFGTYRVTAEHLPTGEAMLVSRPLTPWQDYEWGPSYTTGFTSPGLNIYQLKAEVKRTCAWPCD